MEVCYGGLQKFVKISIMMTWVILSRFVLDNLLHWGKFFIAPFLRGFCLIKTTITNVVDHLLFSSLMVSPVPLAYTIRLEVCHMDTHLESDDNQSIDYCLIAGSQL